TSPPSSATGSPPSVPGADGRSAAPRNSPSGNRAHAPNFCGGHDVSRWSPRRPPMRTLPILLAIVCSLSTPLLFRTAAAQPPTPPPTDSRTGAPRDQRSPFDEVRYDADGHAV